METHGRWRTHIFLALLSLELAFALLRVCTRKARETYREGERNELRPPVQQTPARQDFGDQTGGINERCVGIGNMGAQARRENAPARNTTKTRQNLIN